MSPRAGLDLQTILEAAAAIADKKGMQEVTLASLSQTLGVRSPSLYNHINGLNGLRCKLAVFGLNRLNDRLMRAAVGRSGEDAVLAVGQAYIGFARQHPGLYEATLSSVHDGASEDAETAAELREVSDELVALMIQLIRGEALEEEEAIHLVRGLRSIMHGFASLELAGGFGMPVKLDDSINKALIAYWRGMKNYA
ncbi:TetR/AcrR family transcriptional regulator [Paenibacillus sp. NEAU-GSW1]|uniref:TetR/AcrR family transcriptional regulator n=1 Tax=Paenibacillus sp. NEAU-GSW1 TaxID=2682486 RepID=UPI0012E14A47|nr:TetR/AcrR family transcriptional regulator [Paenibacillus sp. NEAU-GSW1]MUT67588.1 TetR family transcriptional regulator [Paenibacillus sp. NEAU-GSW1]